MLSPLHLFSFHLVLALLPHRRLNVTSPFDAKCPCGRPVFQHPVNDQQVSYLASKSIFPSSSNSSSSGLQTIKLDKSLCDSLVIWKKDHKNCQPFFRALEQQF